MTSRPTDKPLFASTAAGTDIEQPDSSHQGAGWAFKEKPPYEYLNYLMKSYHDWIDYIDAASCETVQGLACWRQSLSVTCREGRARGILGVEDTILLTAPLEKNTQTWAAGDGQGGVPAAQFPWTPDTWKHFFLIKRDSDGVIDAGFDTNLDANILLAQTGFNQYRRVCSAFLVDAPSDFLRSFLHDLNDDSFTWWEGVRDFLGSAPALAPMVVPLTLGAPLGLQLPVEIMAVGSGLVSAWALNFYDGWNGGAGGITDQYQRLVGSAAADQEKNNFRLVTDTSQQIYVEPIAPSTPPIGLSIDVVRYYDKRVVPLSTWY